MKPCVMSDGFYKEVITRALQAINTPFAMIVYYAIVDENFGDVRQPHPDHYDSVTKYYLDAQVYAFVSKNTFFSSKKLDSEIVDSFLRNEELCRQTNSFMRGNDRVGFTPSQIVSARQWCAFFLGEEVPWKHDVSQPYYGPGSTTTNTGLTANIVDKIIGTTEVTYACYPLWESLFGHRHTGARNITRVSKFGFVPKNFKSHRPICIEPGGNMQVQKYLGQLIRDRLLRFKIDLSHVSSRHECLVRDFGEQVSTIDLSAASDTIAFEVVKALVPDAWFRVLHRARSPATTLPDGTIIELEKFSSNGNGYTFELETVLFMSICLSSICARPSRDSFNELRHLFSVYGDDIILPHKYAEGAVKALQYFGFSVNESKTFIDHDFVESCGKDYFKGVDVRPLFLRSKPHEKPESFYSMANQIRRVFHRLASFGHHCPQYPSLRKYLLNGLPYHIRCYGPVRGDDDLWIHTDSRWYPTIEKNGITWIESLSSSPRRRPLRDMTCNIDDSLLIYASLLGDSHGPSLRGPIARLRTQRYSIS